MKSSKKKGSKILLSAGITIAPIFFGLAFLQMLIRPGYSISHNAISQLSLGDLGWIQIGNFILSGFLAILYAIGLRINLRGEKGGTWGPILILIFGLGLITGGIFPPDPGFGFPPGAPLGMPETMSVHATIHTFSFMLITALFAALFVFARRFGTAHKGWMWYCIISGISAPFVIVSGNMNPGIIGTTTLIGAGIPILCASVTASRIRSEIPD